MTSPSTTLPEPFGALRPARVEHQSWARPEASGEIAIGYDANGTIVRVDFVWRRRVSGAGGTVTTAERWAKRPDGAWAYLVRPGPEGVRTVPHGPLRGLLVRHLNIDIGQEPGAEAP